MSEEAHGERQGNKLRKTLEKLEKILEELESKEFPGKENVIRSLEEALDIIEERSEVAEHVESEWEAEDIKEIINAVIPLLDKLGDVVKRILGDIVNQLTIAMDGRKLGEEIGALYSRLRESNLPENLVTEIVRDFYKKRLEAVPNLEALIREILGKISGATRTKISEKEE